MHTILEIQSIREQVIDEEHADGEVIVPGFTWYPSGPLLIRSRLTRWPVLCHGGLFFLSKKSVWLALTFILVAEGHWVVSALWKRLLCWGHGLRPGDAESLCSSALGANHVSSLPRSRAKQQWKKTGGLEKTCCLQKLTSCESCEAKE